MCDIFSALPSGKVGIFWFVPDGPVCRLLADATPLSEAEVYGAFLTHPVSHYDAWSTWQDLPPNALMRRLRTLAPHQHEYEDWPRGRIVLHLPTRTFIVYRDRQIGGLPFMQAVVNAFDLKQSTWRAAGDAHYARARKLKGPPA